MILKAAYNMSTQQFTSYVYAHKIIVIELFIVIRLLSVLIMMSVLICLCNVKHASCAIK